MPLALKRALNVTDSVLRRRLEDSLLLPEDFFALVARPPPRLLRLFRLLAQLLLDLALNLNMKCICNMYYEILKRQRYHRFI